MNINLLLMQLFVALISYLNILTTTTEVELLEPTTEIATIDIDSVNLIRIIKKHETLQLEQYYLFNGWYIGYGHLNKENYRIITKQQADSLFSIDFSQMYNFFSDVKDKRMRLLLASLAYNIGPYKVKKGNVYKYAVKGNKNAFIRSYLRYNKVNGKYHSGLYTRRVNELKTVKLWNAR